MIGGIMAIALFGIIGGIIAIALYIALCAIIWPLTLCDLINISKQSTYDMDAPAMNEQEIPIVTFHPTIERFMGIYSNGVFQRPEGAEVFVVHAEADGVIIPWPEEVSLKDAILEWARAHPIQ